MLPMHLVAGIALGFAATRGAPARLLIAVAAATAIGWGVVIAVFTDSGRLAGLAGGTALAIANLVVGAAFGAIVGAGSLHARRRLS